MTNPASNNFIWALAPASDWAESYPLGDGKIGAMVRGNTTDEVIHLNHGLLWRNYIKKTHEYHTYKDMPQIRSLCLEKKWKEANELMLKTLPTENGIYINPFIPAFDLYITLFKTNENVSNYKRTLDMENGIVTVEFEISEFCSLLNNGAKAVCNAIERIVCNNGFDACFLVKKLIKIFFQKSCTFIIAIIYNFSDFIVNFCGNFF